MSGKSSDEGLHDMTAQSSQPIDTFQDMRAGSESHFTETLKDKPNNSEEILFYETVGYPTPHDTTTGKASLVTGVQEPPCTPQRSQSAPCMSWGGGGGIVPYLVLSTMVVAVALCPSRWLLLAAALSVLVFSIIVAFEMFSSRHTTSEGGFRVDTNSIQNEQESFKETLLEALDVGQEMAGDVTFVDEDDRMAETSGGGVSREVEMDVSGYESDVDQPGQALSVPDLGSHRHAPQRATLCGVKRSQGTERKTLHREEEKEEEKRHPTMTMGHLMREDVEKRFHHAMDVLEEDRKSPEEQLLDEGRAIAEMEANVREVE